MSIKKITESPNGIIQRPYTLVLHHGDYVNNGSRCMLRDTKLYPLESFWTFDLEYKIHGGWPLEHPVQLSHIIAQWRNGHGDEGTGSPYTSLTIVGDMWYFNVGPNGSEKTVIPLRKAKAYVVERFTIRIGFGMDMKVTVDGTDIYSGQTVHDNGRDVEFTTGIYRPWWNENPLYENEPAHRTLDVSILDINQ